MRFAWLVLVTACWTSAPEPAAPAEPEERVEVRRPFVDRTCSMETFDPSNAACESFCVRTAPQGWPGCTRLADQLIAKGYTCTRPTPYACQPPPSVRATCPASGCVPLRARVIAISIDGSATRIKLSAGASMGVALTWTAKLVDENNQPIPNGDIKLVRVDKTMSVGTLSSSPEAVRSAFVLLAP